MTTCIESISCLPTNPLDVFNLYDVTYGTGTSVVILALILGSITLAIYMRTKSLTMLAVLGIYEAATFGVLLTSHYISSQYQTMEWVVAFAAASGGVVMILRLVKE